MCLLTLADISRFAGLACEGDKLLGVVVLTLENEEDGGCWAASRLLPALLPPSGWRFWTLLVCAQPVALFNCHRTAAHPSFRHPATLLMPAAVNRDLPDPSCSCRRHLLVRVQPACGVRPHRPLHAL